METDKNVKESGDLLTRWLHANLDAMRARRRVADDADDHGPLGESGRPCRCGARTLTPHLAYRHAEPGERWSIYTAGEALAAHQSVTVQDGVARGMRS